MKKLIMTTVIAACIALCAAVCPVENPNARRERPESDRCETPNGS